MPHRSRENRSSIRQPARRSGLDVYTADRKYPQQAEGGATFEEIAGKKDELADLCRKHHVRGLPVFGSTLSDDFDPARSDIDFRIEFDVVPDVDYVTNLYALEDAMEFLFARRVHLLTVTTIRNRYLRAEIESTKRPSMRRSLPTYLEDINLAI